jgi:hypothetical protein
VPEVLTGIAHRSLIDEEDVIERILRHLGLWQEGVRVHSGTDPPGETTLDPWLDASSPTTTPNRSWRSPPPEMPTPRRAKSDFLSVTPTGFSISIPTS